MRINCVAGVPLKTLVNHLIRKHGLFSDVILNSLWQMQKYIYETLALNAKPSQAFNGNVKVSELIVITV
jgi:hypothetical protein